MEKQQDGGSEASASQDPSGNESTMQEDIRPRLSPGVQSDQSPQPPVASTDNKESSPVSQPIPSSSTPLIQSRKGQPQDPTPESLHVRPGEPTLLSLVKFMRSEVMKQTQHIDSLHKEFIFHMSNRNKFYSGKIAALEADNAQLKNHISALAARVSSLERKQYKSKTQEVPHPGEGSSDQN